MPGTNMPGTNMLGIFRKSKSPASNFPRNERTGIEGDIYIKRPGKDTLHGSIGNISRGGLYIEILNHDLEKGRKVEIILVMHAGSVK